MRMPTFRQWLELMALSGGSIALAFAIVIAIGYYRLNALFNY